MKQRILFLCTGNSCRSQMAEGWMRHFHGAQFDVFSAGVETHGINPLAQHVMTLQGVDITHHQSTHIDTLAHIDFDYAISVCDNAQRRCPIALRSRFRIHQPFPDPPRIAKQLRQPEEILACYRRVCGEIQQWIHQLPQQLPA